MQCLCRAYRFTVTKRKSVQQKDQSQWATGQGQKVHKQPGHMSGTVILVTHNPRGRLTCIDRRRKEVSMGITCIHVTLTGVRQIYAGMG